MVFGYRRVKRGVKITRAIVEVKLIIGKVRA
jgi:hypothetical protein